MTVDPDNTPEERLRNRLLARAKQIHVWSEIPYHLTYKGIAEAVGMTIEEVKAADERRRMGS